MERVGVLVHPTRPVQNAADFLQRWTADRGLRLVQIRAGEQPPVAPSGEVSACDLVTALGGDGTILKALHAAGRTGTPVLSVACGSLGILTTVPENELRTALDRRTLCVRDARLGQSCRGRQSRRGLPVPW
jgi:NAD+ kinase